MSSANNRKKSEITVKIIAIAAITADKREVPSFILIKAVIVTHVHMIMDINFNTAAVVSFASEKSSIKNITKWVKIKG